MASNYAASLDSLTNPLSTDNLSSPDHASQHTNANDILENIETTLGTTAGTSVIQHFAAGQFAVRHTGVAATGTLAQTLVGGTYNSFTAGTPAITGGTVASGVVNNSTIGTPAITGGTYNNFTAGTPTVAGTIILPNTVIPTAAIVNNAVTSGSLLFALAPTAATVTAGAFTTLGGQGTFVTTGGALLLVSSFNTFQPASAASDDQYRFIGTAGVGTFTFPASGGFAYRFSGSAGQGTSQNFSLNGIIPGVAAGTYICQLQGSVSSSGSIITTTNTYLTASLVELKK